MLKNLKEEILLLKDISKAKILSGFFKTGIGEYGYGDVFFGLNVPQERNIAKKYSLLGYDSLKELISSPIHDERMIAVFILLEKLKKASSTEKKTIFDFYIENMEFINNWDLVDLSAPKIVGEFLYDKDRKLLYDLAASENLWEKRIAIISTFCFIRNEDFKDTIDITKILMNDPHDLIHKACGWMLREIGKRNISVLRGFLDVHKNHMPRTMLRYSIEKMDEDERKRYMKKD
ncbi:MAG: DNA alkylation repair protein [Candidatus Gracilibacteria bacterium]|nr:DNA alkylation repair protein [Candidatus Gracilibacteria bacterium]